MSDPITVGLVDDQQLVRAGLAMVIAAQPDMRVSWEADSGEEAIRLAGTPTDVILMDVRMPGMDGIEATRRILEGEPCAPTRIVMLTTYDVDEYLLSAIRAGASGFLLKNAPPADLLDAIRTVHAGDAVVAPSSTRRLLAHVATATPPPNQDDPRITSLTDREREILTLIARGLSNAELSAFLFLSETTVKTHVRHILAKLGVRDRVQAVVVAYETGLAHS